MNVLPARTREEHLLNRKGEPNQGRREHIHPGCSNMGGPEDICIANEGDSVEMGETGGVRTRRTAEARP